MLEYVCCVGYVVGCKVKGQAVEWEGGDGVVGHGGILGLVGILGDGHIRHNRHIRLNRHIRHNIVGLMGACLMTIGITGLLGGLLIMPIEFG